MFSIYRDVQPRRFPVKLGCVGLLLIVIGEVLDIYGLAANNMIPRIVAVVLRYVLYALALIQWLPPSYKILAKYLRDGVHRSLNDSDVFTLLLTLQTCINIFGLGLLPFTGLDGRGIFFIEDFNPSYLIGYCCITSAMSFISTVIPTRCLMQRSLAMEIELKSKRDYVRQISHELRTPLNAMSVGLSLALSNLKNQTRDDDLVEVLVDVEESCTETLDIIKSILEFENTDDGDEELKLVPVRILPLLNRAIRPMIVKASVRDVRINFGPQQHGPLASNNWCIDCDSEKVIHVIKILIGYALQNSPKGEAIDVLPGIRSEEDESILCLKIIDHGRGLSRQALSTVFTGEYDDTHEERFNVGMQLAKKLVEKHGGKLSMESSAGWDV
jgi:signal transduction histidine kinase